MTNYNERLDEIFNTLPVHGIISSDGIRDDYWDAVNARTKLKQAITSLIKELVEEARPELLELKEPVTKSIVKNRCETVLIDLEKDQNGSLQFIQDNGYNNGIDEYHTNLLKALEEK